MKKRCKEHHSEIYLYYSRVQTAMKMAKDDEDQADSFKKVSPSIISSLIFHFTEGIRRKMEENRGSEEKRAGFKGENSSI